MTAPGLNAEAEWTKGDVVEWAEQAPFGRARPYIVCWDPAAPNLPAVTVVPFAAGRAGDYVATFGYCDGEYAAMDEPTQQQALLGRYVQLTGEGVSGLDLLAAFDGIREWRLLSLPSYGLAGPARFAPTLFLPQARQFAAR